MLTLELCVLLLKQVMLCRGCPSHSVVFTFALSALLFPKHSEAAYRG